MPTKPRSIRYRKLPRANCVAHFGNFLFVRRLATPGYYRPSQPTNQPTICHAYRIYVTVSTLGYRARKRGGPLRKRDRSALMHCARMPNRAAPELRQSAIPIYYTSFNNGYLIWSGLADKLWVCLRFSCRASQHAQKQADVRRAAAAWLLAPCYHTPYVCIRSQLPVAIIVWVFDMLPW